MMKTSPPSVSVVITTYQRPVAALRAVRSVLAQTAPINQIFVIEDGSESDLQQTLQELPFRKVTYIAHQTNKGLSAARNTGLNLCDTDYVAFLDDDDEWMDSKISEQIALAIKTNEQHACIYCAADILDESGTYLGTNRPKLQGSIREEIKNTGLFTIPSSCLFKRSALMKIGGYDEFMRSHIDHDIWMSLAKHNYSCVFTSQSLVKTYEHTNRRITTDTKARLHATCVFCNKWKPDLILWFGDKKAQRHLAEFKARVHLMLGSHSLKAGKKLPALQHYLTALMLDPANRKCRKNLSRVIMGKTS